MTFVFPPWMKTALIIGGIIVLIAMLVFLYLLIAGSDESRRSKGKDDTRNSNSADKQQ